MNQDNVANKLASSLEAFAGLDSCLSPPVADLLMEKGVSNSRLPLLNHLCLNWPLLASLIAPTTDGCDDPREEYRRLTSRVAPVINDVFLVYESPEAEESLQLLLDENLQWMGHHQEVMKKAFAGLKKQTQRDAGAQTILSSLIVTSCLERSLGNLVLVKRAFVPPLLKDLLVVPELEQMIGPTAVKCLQIIIGPPVSLNIRNLLWHSFVFPNELSPRYCHFLFSLAFSIGLQLKKNGYFPQELPERPLLAYRNTDRLNSIFPELEEQDLDMMLNQFKSIPLILSPTLSLWELAMKMFLEEEYGFALVLLLPLLENVLRLIYAAVNDVHIRILSAQSAELYTTFSEILSQHLVDSLQINHFINVFSLSQIEMLMDLLFNPEGLRIRDKLSHGEVDLTRVPKWVPNHVLCATYSLLAKVSATDVSASVKFSIILEVSLRYRSHCYCNSQLRSSLCKAFQSLTKWERDSFLENVTEKDNIVLLQLQNSLVGSHDNQLNPSKITKLLDDLDIPTLFRSKAEIAFVTLLRQITEPALTASQQITAFLSEKEDQLARKQLRSRQRDNYNRLLRCSDRLFIGLLFVFLMSSTYLKSLNTIPEEGSQQRPMIYKRMKLILQYSQNLASSSHKSQNKWEECAKLSASLCSEIHSLLEISNIEKK